MFYLLVYTGLSFALPAKGKPPMLRVTPNPPTPIVASTARFVGRAQQIAQFRDSVRYALGTQNAPPDRDYTLIFIAHGEGSMGKSSLLPPKKSLAEILLEQPTLTDEALAEYDRIRE